jgi:hypothetical protein
LLQITRPAVPWVKPDVHEKIASMTPEEFARLMASSHAIFTLPGTTDAIHGVFPRLHGSPYYMTPELCTHLTSPRG